MRFIKIFAGVLSLIFLAGCSGGTQTIQTTSYTAQSKVSSFSVSPIMYETFDCEQVSAEAASLSDKTQKLTGIKNSVSGTEKVVIWPAGLRQSPVNETSGAELGRIKYQFEALEKASKREGCNIQFQRQAEDNFNEQKSAQLSLDRKTS